MIQSEDPEGTESAATFARMRFGSDEVTAPCELVPPLKEERPLGRLQHLSGARKDGSHPLHRVTRELAHHECG